MSREYSNSPTDSFKDTASEVKDRVSDFAADAKEKASKLADDVSESAGRQRENAAKGLHRAASAIQDNAGKLGSGRASDAARKVAQCIDSTASYLQDHDFNDMRKDVMDVCRRHPAEAILSSLALGFLLGRAMRR